MIKQQQLAVMHHLVGSEIEVGVLVEDGVEAVGAGGEHLLDPVLLHVLDVLLGLHLGQVLVAAAPGGVAEAPSLGDAVASAARLAAALAWTSSTVGSPSAPTSSQPSSDSAKAVALASLCSGSSASAWQHSASSLADTPWANIEGRGGAALPARTASCRRTSPTRLAPPRS